MNRRKALSTMTLSTLALAGASSRASAANTRKSIPASQPIRVALIGAQKIGAVTHLPTLVGDEQCRLVAICDVDRKVLAKAMKQAKGLYAAKGNHDPILSTGDFREIMANPEIDAVVIATPDHWHVPLAKAAVMAGKDVYVEKPLSFYVTEGRELLDFVQDRDAIVQVGTQHRTMDRIFLAQAVVQSGLIGEVKHADVVISTRSGEDIPFEVEPVPPELDYDMWVGPAQWCDYNSKRVHYNFRFVSEFSGGEIANWGAHFLDSAQQCLGLDGQSPIRVQGSGKRRPVGGIHNSFYEIDVDYAYANGMTMKLKSSSKGNPMGITFHGEKGSLFVNRNAFKIDDPDLMRALPKVEAKALRKTDGSHMSNWLQCIRTRKKENLHAPLDNAHGSSILCHMANISIEVGRPLQWDSENEVFVNDAFASAMLNRPVRKEWKL